jgi:DNA-binding response OmpR family regulator
MAENQTILVVEDEEAILMGITENLKVEGYHIIAAQDGPAALRLGVEKKPDLIILDIMLPGMSGYDVCRKLRDQKLQMPIIMLTARQEEFDKLHGFEMGADDYMTKPFSIKELLARVHAVLLRGRQRSEEPQVYAFADCELDMSARVLKRGGKEVKLTRTEFDLMAYFCAHEGQALSRDKVMNGVWGVEYYGTQRSLDSFVASLRHKIEKKSSKPTHILTVHGVGYKFVGD